MSVFVSAKEIARKWKISQRRVSVLCNENRVNGAMMVGNMWIIPSDSEKPLDKRAIRYKNTKSITLKPFVKWAGGKSQLADEIENLIPAESEKHIDKYVEPMVGGGALLFNLLSKYNFKEIYISDINSELINTYQVIKTQVENLISTLEELETKFLYLNEIDRKQFYYVVRKDYNSNDLNAMNKVRKAAQFIFLNKTCYNGLYRVNKKGHYNVPMGSYKKPVICDKENLINIHKALQNVTIVCGDYSLSKMIIDKNTLVYIDPPYRPISKTADFTAYNSVIFDDNEQIRLAKFIDEINEKGASVVLSNSDPKNVKADDNFFDELYKNYKIKRVQANRMINSNAKKRGKIYELLIYN